ncbi:MAG: prevent-host-death protein [Campylobacter sp.]
MATFSKDEIYTATQIVRNFSTILTKVGKNDMKRAVIVKNNKFEAVLLNMGEYERLCEAVDVLESIYSARKKADNGE